MYVYKKWIGFIGVSVRVCINGKLHFQNTLYLSEKSPFCSASSLQTRIASRFSAIHCLRFSSLTLSAKACSRVAERLMFKLRASSSKSLLMLRFVAFFDGFLSVEDCTLSPVTKSMRITNAHYSRGGAFNTSSRRTQ